MKHRPIKDQVILVTAAISDIGLGCALLAPERGEQIISLGPGNDAGMAGYRE